MEIKEFLIDEEKNLLEAMSLLDKVAKKVLFVTKEGKFVGAITDGDIRRWILKKGSLDAKVKDIANYNPIYVSLEDKSRAKSYMKKKSIEALPVVNKVGDIVSIVFLNDKEVFKKGTLDIPVVIMAGGKGTRLYPYTKILPKPLIPIGEIPIVEHIINRFNHFGVERFFLILNHKKNMVKAYFSEVKKSYEIEYIDEDKPLGTGGGLSLLKEKIDSTFILSNCDILIQEDYEKLYRHHREQKNKITMVCSLKNIKIPYGVIEIGESGEIESMKEKPEVSFFTNTGVYVIEPEVLDEIGQGEIVDFPDIIERVRNQGSGRVGVYPISEKSWMDMGEIESMEDMRQRLGIYE